MMRIIIAIAVVATIFAATIGAAADMTFPSGMGGNVAAGASNISNYQISSVNWELDPGNPTVIKSVSVTLNTAAEKVYIAVASVGSSSPACTGYATASNTGGNTWKREFSTGPDAGPTNALCVSAEN